MNINLSKTTFRGFAFAFILCLGSSMLLQAQTLQDLGEIGASNLEAEFNAEIADLDAELNQPPANVSVEYNQALVTGYKQVLSSFFEGEDLKTEFITFLEGGVMQPNDDENTTSQTYSTGNNFGADNPLQDVIDFIQGWTLRANDLSDLEEAFEMIRTIKNQ